MDIHASLGSVSSVDLVVRGDRYARRAHAYSSHCGDRMNFEPNTTFQLVPGAFNRVAVQFSPNVAGTRYLLFHNHTLYLYISKHYSISPSYFSVLSPHSQPPSLISTVVLLLYFISVFIFFHAYSFSTASHLHLQSTVFLPFFLISSTC